MNLDEGSHFQLNLLGGFSLIGPVGKPIEMPSRKNRLLLAYLARPVGTAHSRDQLASLLWPDRQQEQARSSLRTALSGLRHALGADAITVDQDLIALAAGAVVTDVHVLEQAARGDATLRSGTDLYPGPFLNGHEPEGEDLGDWLLLNRREVEQTAVRALGSNAARLLGQGDHRGAIEFLREALKIEPLLEQTHRDIMAAYAAMGERAMAIAQFRSCRDLLKAELDADPDPQTQALADRIALGDTDIAETLRRQTLTLVPPAPVLAEVKQAPPKEPSGAIAVLPFINMSGDAEQSYFADGITEDIITDLTHLNGVSVAAKGLVQLYRDTEPAQRIAGAHGIRYVLEGSVRKAGETVRISAQLNDTRSGLQIWAERYDRKLDNIFELQTEISRQIVTALKLNVANKTHPASELRGTTSVEAYQCYLRGRAQVTRLSKKNLLEALELFERAVKLDENYALAHAGCLDATVLLHLHYKDTEHLLPAGKAHGERALALNPNLAEAHCAMAGYWVTQQNYPAAYELAKRAIDERPDYAFGHHEMGSILISSSGDLSGAHHHFSRAFDLAQDPNSAMMMFTSSNGGVGPEERRLCGNRILDFARRRLELDPYELDAVFLIAMVLTTSGDRDEAVKWNEMALAFDPTDGRTLCNLACNFAMLGLADRAFDVLEQSLVFGVSKAKLDFIRQRDPDMDNLRKDARFIPLMDRFV